MNNVLLVIVILELLYIFYQDVANRKERERLELKLMSRDLTEYKEATEKPIEEKSEKEASPYVPVEDVSVEKLMGAEDKL